MTYSSLAWTEHALCRQVGSEPFFVDDGASVAPARRICARCPVAEPCLNYALTTMTSATDVGGVYGGTTYTQRRELRAKGRAA
jgi:WhiB family redox-sensing transcriptional regulator